MSFRQTNYGEYILLRPLTSGGMAELFLARRRDSNLGADRLLVVKKIASESATDPEFTVLFKQEVAISLKLSHPNIVQTYDYGLAEGDYFMALEFVHGVNLADLLVELKEQKQPMPVEVAAHICSQVCSALAYTHAYRDPLTGEHKTIIHRDISPHNIMVGQIGVVKLFDFGIAKIEDQRGVTRTGMIRGKLAYLSPEQASQRELDARSDLFTVGVVLWELLTGRRLFAGKDTTGSISLILEKPIPAPSSVNRLVPKELDQITLKALERDKIMRYQLAQDFYRDLHHFVQQRHPGFGPNELSGYLQKVFKNRFHEEEEEIRRLLNNDSEQAALAEEGDPTRSSLVWDGMEKTANIAAIAGVDFENGSGPLPQASVKKTPHSTYSKASAGYGAPMQAPPKIDPLLQKNKRSGIGRSLTATLLLAAAASGYFWFQGKKKPAAIPARAPAAVSQEEFSPPPSPINGNMIKIVADKPDFRVSVNGSPVAMTGEYLSVPASGKARIRAELPGHIPVEWDYYPTDLPVKAIHFVPAVAKGLLYFTTTPDARLRIYQGDTLVQEAATPIDRLELPEGEYRILIQNEFLNHESEVRVKIERDKATRMSKALR